MARSIEAEKEEVRKEVTMAKAQKKGLSLPWASRPQLRTKREETVE